MTETLTPTPRTAVPPLEPGDHLTRVEFEARYEATPDNPKAELLDGVVYMPSPTRMPHGSWHSIATAWLTVYAARTPGTQPFVDTTVRLDDRCEPKPDAFLRLLPRAGGRTRDDPDPDGYAAGGPELVVEVATSRASYDLHVKKAVFRRHGVPEYVVAVTHTGEVLWHVLRGGEYELHPADARGVLRSTVFPGLWLDAPALVRGDAAAVLALLEEGLATPEHAAFARDLALRLGAP